MTPAARRTLGRRKWMDHWTIRLSIAFGAILLAVSLVALFFSIKKLKDPVSPHFKESRCFACHEALGSKMTPADCFKCHDSLTRELLPNAIADRKAMRGKPCSHPIKATDDKGVHSITKLCTSCHPRLNAYVSLMNIQTQKYVEIDISATHPVGLLPTETIYPRTLKLEEGTGAINCVTCHDPHGSDHRFHLLRYYHPGNGRPADFRPLCHDCHTEDWLPLRLDVQTIVRHDHNQAIGH